jgi:TP901-1 family phage major tail protein
MAAGSGRKLRIKKGGTSIAGATTENLTINNEPIDITDKDDAGWRTLLADAGVRSVDASVEGYLVDSTLIAVSTGAVSGLNAAYTLEIDGLGDFAGNFFLNSLEIGGETAGAITFTASIQSSGAITFTPD